MKKLFFLLAILISTGWLSAQTWTWDREPEAGQNVNIQIDGVPVDEGPLHVVYYFLDGTKLVCADAGLLPAERPSQLKVAIALHDHISWIYVTVKDEYNQIGSADQKFVKNATALPNAGPVEHAVAASLYGRMMAMDANDADVLADFRTAVKANSFWLESPDVLRGYYLMAKKASSTEDLDLLKNYMSGLTASNGSSEELLVQACRVSKDMGDSTLNVSLRKRLDKKYPKSLLAQEDMLSSFTKASTIEEKIKIRDKFKSMYPVTKDNTRMMDQMTSTLAQDASGKNDWSKVKTYIDQLIDPMTKASVCNNYAWTLSGESIDAPAINLDMAATLSAASLSALSPDNPLPTGITKKEWTRVMDNSKGMYGDTYALILYKQGKYDEALSYQSYAVANNKYEDGEMNERYAMYLSKAGRTKDLEKFMDQIIITGKATEKVKAMHHDYWTQTASKEQLYQQYIMQLENQAKALRHEEIMKTWEDTDAPPFILVDLAGNIVKLADYRGKTVILDFWATWCGPCKASFPGMKQAVEHFASDDNVVFLFVDTWENGSNIKGRVEDFITTNNYPFHVVLDSENKVVNDYKVSGIPTKFIIGPDQKIHFRAVGYSGNNDELVEEIKTMIEIVQTNAGMSKS